MNWLPILTVCVQVTLIAAVGLLAAGLLRSAAHRHCALLAALLCILAAPLFYIGTTWTGLTINLAAAFPAPREREQVVSLPAGQSRVPHAGADQVFPELATESPEVAFQPVSVLPTESPTEPMTEEVQQRPADPAAYFRADWGIAGIWLAGTLFSLLGVVRSQLKTDGILRAARPVGRSIEPDLVAKAEQKLNAAGRLRIATTGQVAGPVVVGIFQPWILIPARYLETLSREELLQVLIHEGAHALRRDPLVALLQRIASALFWWHPLVHVVNRELTRAREGVCDNFVLTCTEPETYGATLFRLATLSPAMAQFPLAIGMFDSREKLENRVGGLLDSRRIIMTRVRFATGATVLGAFGLFSVVVAAARVGAENPAGPPTVDPVTVAKNAGKETAKPAESEDGDTDESKVIEKIALLGGKSERADKLPGRPVISVDFRKTNFLSNDELRLLKAFKKLTKLRFNRMNDEGLKEVGKLKNLRELELYHPAITDAGLKELKDLKDLVSLELIHSRITGSGLKELWGLTNLTKLALNMSEVTDEGLKELAGFKNLTDLSLARTRITRAPLEQVKGLKNLKKLYLDLTRISDAGLRDVGELQNLTELGLGGTRITDAGLEELSKLKYLTTLFLHDTAVTDEGLRELRKHNQLAFLNLGHTKITDFGLRELRDLKKLTHLDLSATEITDEGLGELTDFHNLTELNLDGTDFSDEGLPALRHLHKLLKLTLNQTQITDAALKDLSQLKSLTVLYLPDTISDAGLKELKRSLPTTQIGRSPDPMPTPTPMPDPQRK